MAFLDHNGESEFPFTKNQVFAAMCMAIPLIKGMKIESADSLQGRIFVNSGVSLYSWGENIPIQLLEVSPNKTRVQITSSPKTGMMFGGASDMGKNRKNIERILSSTSMILSSNQAQTNLTVQNQAVSENIQRVYHEQNKRLILGSYALSTVWYEKTWLVIFLCIFLFPIGLYALWKNSSISNVWKIIITIIIAFIVIVNLGSNKPDTSAIEKTSTKEVEQPENVSVAVPDKKENVSSEKDIIIKKLKAKAKEDWPDDYTTQEFWVNKQIEDYEYMLNIDNNSIKRQAQRDWPLDFSTQRFWYKQQIEAKERMEQ